MITMDALRQFHPAVARWFAGAFPAPTEPQREAWPSIHRHRHTLIAAPTGSGKTLAAFLAAIDDLVRQADAGTLTDAVQVVYVSPLKALSNDIQKNLQEPLAGVRAQLETLGKAGIDIRAQVRTGDTPAHERAAMLKRPPHILVTTPESLYILLTSERGAQMLTSVKTVIVDEIHAIVGSKRGSHLALTLERLAAAAENPLLRVGLSATQKPMESVARFLLGERADKVKIVDAGHVRKIDLALELPKSPLEAVMSNEVWEENYERLAELVNEHKTTLVFVNTRRMAERVARHLADRLGDDAVTSHHGSLSKERRLDAETRLKTGKLKALVATASLELGIDIGHVDLVCQLGSPRSIAGLLQRVGRSGHAVMGQPRGRLFPLSRDELVECAALIRAVKAGELDKLVIPEAPLDVLAQQIVAIVAGGETTEDALFALVRRAWPYRNLSRHDFDAVVRMLADGYTTRRGRHHAYLHHDRVQHMLRPRRNARLAAVTSGGAIPDTADYDVIVEPDEGFVGTVNEDFAIESMPGDVFQLGNASWRILRVEKGRLRVEDAHGQPPTIPFWIGEAPGRTKELSSAVSQLRAELETHLTDPDDDALDWLKVQPGIGAAAAEQIVEYLDAARRALGTLPTQQTIVLERFFDEAGGMQLVIHSPFGSRLNRAWGLALRKRFCRKFNFELQAAAGEDAIVLSLGATHSFPLEEVFEYLSPKTVREVLVQALLAAPMFNVRWRWNANTALAILRRRGGKKNPAPLQRMEAEDLVATVFPDQIACAENLAGEREVPDHPLVNQTIKDCLTEAMDIDRLEALLADMQAGKIKLVARDLTEPSPLAHEILSARPYTFLDDAPLEERRTQAVQNRRWLDPESADELGRLDAAAIARERDEVWPRVESVDELHDALTQMSYFTPDEGKPYAAFFDTLVQQKRAAVLKLSKNAPALWVSSERLEDWQTAFPAAKLTPALTVPSKSKSATEPETPDAAKAFTEIIRGRLEGLGPAAASSLAASLGLPADEVNAPLYRLESEGFVLRGRFSPDTTEIEWCVRHLLARIHRYTLNRLRQEIEPVSSEAYMRFLFEWQGVANAADAEGPGSLARIVEQLEGFEASATAWEGDILPSRLADYDPSWLDTLCLSGKVTWKRLSPPKGSASGIIRTTPIALLLRHNQPLWDAVRELEAREQSGDVQLSNNASAVFDVLAQRGALFFGDIVSQTRLLPTMVEDALGELVALGLVTADSYQGLRSLLTPSDKRPARGGFRRRGAALFGIEDAGRWTLVATPPYPRTESTTSAPRRGAPIHADRSASENRAGGPPTGGHVLQDGARQGETREDHIEELARIYLVRYGVVFRKVLERESWTPPWRELLRVYRRLEARGEIRGGRFVSGYWGEQYAMPDALERLRKIRKAPAGDDLVSLSGADPLNMFGILIEGGRLAATASNRILFRGGVPVAVLDGGEMRQITPVEGLTEWEMRKVLVHRSAPGRLKAYLGRQAH